MTIHLLTLTAPLILLLAIDPITRALRLYRVRKAARKWFADEWEGQKTSQWEEKEFPCSDAVGTKEWRFMQRIVYLLGAGFSAPLGLPVMANFLMRSKDMYFRDMTRYKDFAKVFQTIDSMSKTKNYYSADLFNIEEILSISEMRESLSARNYRKLFVAYISDVISYYTPPKPKKATTAMEWHNTRFNEQLGYGRFVGNLMNASIRYSQVVEHNVGRVDVTTKRDLNRQVEYSVVSLNYDMILENLWDSIKGDMSNVEFGHSSDSQTVCLAKLHGSINEDIMVAPTWNKTIKPIIRKVWQAAFNALTNANEIRIIGYSLPVADAYIKYLLKAAVIDSPHLRHIDILLKGDDRETIRRYGEFITFHNTRLSIQGVESYIQKLSRGSTVGVIECNNMESCHHSFFDSSGASLLRSLVRSTDS